MSALHQLIIQTLITLPFAIGFFIWIGLRQQAKTKGAARRKGTILLPKKEVKLWYGDETQEEVKRMLEEVQDSRSPYSTASI